MRFTTLVIMALFILPLSANSQQLTSKIDSIKIYHLPLKLHTTISLDGADAVRDWKEEPMGIKLLNIHVESDSLKLLEFIETDISNPIYKTDFLYSLDIRIVIDVYGESGKLTIEMSKSGYYKIGNEKEQRSRNPKLIKWLQRYIPDLI